MVDIPEEILAAKGCLVFLESIPENTRTANQNELLTELKRQKEEYDEFDKTTNLRKNSLLMAGDYPHSMYYDMQGKPMSTWDFLNDFNERHIALDVINGYRISTVWMGIDHNFFRKGLPVIFETMIFKEDGAEGDDLAGYQDRYCLKELALEGHRKACDLVLEKTTS
jgi:hypothetical protein